MNKPTDGLIANAAPQQQHTTVNVEGGDDNAIKQIFRASSHPKVLFFHLIFRTAAFILFLVEGLLFSSSEVLMSIIIILLLAFDFWTVKNLSGRLLVGMRWWNETNEQGVSSWIFEAKKREEINKADSNVFWISLYAFGVAWAAMIIVEIFRFKAIGLVIVLVAFSLNSANIVGYTKCNSDAKQKFQGMVSQGIMAGLMTNTFGSWVSR